jgi:hypothetical protein
LKAAFYRIFAAVLLDVLPEKTSVVVLDAIAKIAARTQHAPASFMGL